jgi:hypothetical protein
LGWTAHYEELMIDHAVNPTLPAGSKVQAPLRAIVCSRSFLIAGCAYFLLLCGLFWRLFIGEIWNSNAGMRFAPPFASPAKVDAAPYVSIWEVDFSTQFIFFQEYQRNAARQGRFPTWNPHIYLGQPFHADGQSAMLHPFDWIYFLVDPDSARGWMAIVRLWFSAVAVFCLLRKLELIPSAAFVGGAAWVFGSFNMHWLAWPQTNASLWMPVVILALDYLLVGPSLRMTAVAALVTAPLFLSGHPGTEYIAGQIIGFYVLCRLISIAREGIPMRGIVVRVGALGVALILGLLLAAAAWLPLWMQIRQSYEYLDPSGARGKLDPLPAAALWLMLLPDYFGRVRGAFPNSTYDGPENYIEMSLYFGAIALGLALTTLLSLLLPDMITSRRTREERRSFPAIFGVVTFILSLLAVFCLEPVHSIAASLPGSGLTSLRRLLMANNFAGALLAAVCMQQILGRKDRAVAVLAGVVCLGLCGLGAREVLAHWHLHQQQMTEALAALYGQYGPASARVANAMKLQSAVYRVRAGAGIMLLGVGVLLWVVQRILRRQPVSAPVRYLLVAIIAIDVMLPAVEWQPIAPRKMAIPQVPEILRTAIARSGEGRMLGTDQILPPNTAMHFGFRDLRGYDLPHSLRLVRLLERLNLNQLDSRGYIMLDRVCPRISPEIEAYLDRTCVRCLLACDTKGAMTSPSLAPGDRTLGIESWSRIGGDESGNVLLANPNAYPRVYLARFAEAAMNPMQAMGALLDLQTDLRNRSVYEGSAQPQEIGNGSTESSASITRDDPEKVVIAARASTRQLLVLADRMDIGWQVQIDGQPAEALTANYLFRGVFVPPGDHTVEWTYRAPGLTTGVTISLATLVLVAAMPAASFFAQVRHRRKKTPHDDAGFA